MTNNLPNLMTAGTDELWGVWTIYNRATRKTAKALIGDRRKGYTNLAATFGNIACNLAVANKCLIDGDHDGAAIYRHCAEIGRQNLPEDLQVRFGLTEPLCSPVDAATPPKPIGHPFNPHTKDES